MFGIHLAGRPAVLPSLHTPPSLNQDRPRKKKTGWSVATLPVRETHTTGEHYRSIDRSAFDQSFASIAARALQMAESNERPGTDLKGAKEDDGGEGGGKKSCTSAL